MSLPRLFLALVAAVSFLVWAGSGCQFGRLRNTTQGSRDLLEEVEKQGIKRIYGDDQKLFLYRFSRGGTMRDTLVLTPGARLEIPAPSPQVRCISLWVGMPFNLGDGAGLQVNWKTESGLKELARRNLDPAHIRADRDWQALTLDIPSGENAGILELQVDSGARGDHSGDWVGLAPGPDTSCWLALPGRTSTFH